MNYSITVIRIQSVMQVTDSLIINIKIVLKLLLKAQTTTGANGERDGFW